MTVAPSLPEYSCQGDEWSDSDPNTRVVYSGGARTAPGTVAFDVPAASILPGVYGQRACLSEVATINRQEPVCIVQAPILGKDPHTFCPFVNTITQRFVAGKTITPTQTAVGNSTTPPTTPPTSPGAGPALPQPISLSKSEARNRAAKP